MIPIQATTTLTPTAGDTVAWLESDAHRSMAQALGRKFEVLDELGRGAMGVVLRVKHLDLDREMAVKVMNASAFSPAQYTRFKREARAAGDLSHPNIVRVHDLDRALDGSPFIVMEKLEGATLFEVLEREGAMSPDRVYELLSGVADALDQAHSKGIVHRDLKPANLFLTKDGVLKLLDFGVCHDGADLSKVTAVGQMVGTPAYMAPEQFRGQEPSAQTDIFSLTAIAYEMLGGGAPFEGSSVIELASRRKSQKPRRIEKLRPEVSGAIGDVLEKGMSYVTAQRHQSAGALMRAFGAAREPSSTGSRSGKLVWAAVIVGLLALATVMVFALRTVDNASSPQDSAGPLGPADAGASGPTDVKERPRENAAVWPAVPRLLVFPFAHDAQRETDRDLWPLVNRMVVNALNPDDRVAERLVSIDPKGVAEAIKVARFEAPFSPDEIVEIAGRMGADVVLTTKLARVGGRLRVDARLFTTSGSGAAEFQVEAPRLRSLVLSLVAKIREELWGGPPRSFSPGRMEQLLVSKEESLAALYEVTSFLAPQEYTERLRSIIEADPDAIGARWMLYLADPHDEDARRALGEHASSAKDAELVRFFAAIGRKTVDQNTCDGVDTDKLGTAYPDVLGPLADSVCHQMRGQWEPAIKMSWNAFSQPSLRGMAGRILHYQLFLARECDDLLAKLEEVLSLSPENVHGWGVSARWFARCERFDEAQRMIDVARVLLGHDKATRCAVAGHGAWIHLAALDIEGAGPWLEMYEQNLPDGRPARTYYLLTMLSLHMQGRHRAAISRAREGMDAFRESTRTSYSTMAVSAFYGMLQQGDVAGAQEIFEEVKSQFEGSRAVDDRNLLSMFRLAIGWNAKEVGLRELEAALSEWRATLEAEYGDLGRSEAGIQECMLYTYLGLSEKATELMVSADQSNKLLGGCRLREAQRLLRDKRSAEAVVEFRKTVHDIVWARFIYADLLPEALLGYGQALQGSGRVDEARKIYEGLINNGARAERVMPEVVAARKALAGLR